MTKCQATCASCRCKLDEHDKAVFHECMDEACNGAWRWEGSTFEIGRFPGTTTSLAPYLGEEQR